MPTASMSNVFKRTWNSALRSDSKSTAGLARATYFSEMPSQPPDLAVLVEALNRHDVRWVLIGGLALMLHGGNYPTMDADVAFAPDWDNVDRLVEGLAHLNPRPVRARKGFYEWDRKATTGPFVRLTTDAGEIDLIRRLPGIDSFESLYERSTERVLYGLKFRIASLDDLIAMKSGSARTKDQLQLLELHALKKLQSTS